MPCNVRSIRCPARRADAVRGVTLRRGLPSLCGLERRPPLRCSILLRPESPSGHPVDRRTPTDVAARPIFHYPRKTALGCSISPVSSRRRPTRWTNQRCVCRLPMSPQAANRHARVRLHRHVRVRCRSTNGQLGSQHRLSTHTEAYAILARQAGRQVQLFIRQIGSTMGSPIVTIASPAECHESVATRRGNLRFAGRSKRPSFVGTHRHLHHQSAPRRRWG